MLMLSDADTCALVGMPEAIEVIRGIYRDLASGGAVHHDRTIVRVPGGWMRMLPGSWPARGYLGYKEFHLVGPVVRHTTVLISADSGEHLAVLDASHLTGLRTGATAAVAAEAMVARGDLAVAVVGAGKEARAQLTALALVRDVRSVRVFSPREESRRQFAADLADVVPGIEPANSIEAACAGADVVLAATKTGGTPVLTAAHVAAGVHVSSIGSTLPEQREVDADLWRAASRIVVDTSQVLDQGGDALAAARPGHVLAPAVEELADVVGRAPSQPAAGPTLFTSLGAGIQDVAVAVAAYERALEAGLGVRTPPWSLARTV